MAGLSVIAYKVIMAVISLYEYTVYKVLCQVPDLVRKQVFLAFSKRGIQIDPEEKVAKPGDVRVHNQRLFPRMAAYRTLGLGEAYMEGWWDCDDVEEFFYTNFITSGYKSFFRPFHNLLNYLQFQLFNLQTPSRSWEVGEKHYDQGNDLFEHMLDKNMNYSCGYWKDASDLDGAQRDKMDLIARKLKLEAGMRVLDIGCGWGGLCKYLAENYDVKVVGITVSVEGARYAEEKCRGLAVDIRVTDYRDLDETFDRIVSVGMFEHVGYKNYETFFKVARKCLTKDGIFLLHTIAVNCPSVPVIEPWFNTYIFPNGILPTPGHITKETNGLFIIEDWHNISYNYCKTLRAWLENFNASWPLLKKNYKEPEKFYRMWTYYLQTSSAAFRSRKYQCWQIVLSKNGVAGGYDAPR